MRLIRILFFFLSATSFVFPFKANGQTLTQTVRGIVIDADSRSELPGASVWITGSDTSFSTMTTIDGKFRLEKIPVGRRALKVTYVGYEDVLMNNIVVTSGKEVVLNIEMREKVIIGDEVVITPDKDKTKANNELVTNSSRNFNSEETERYAGSRGDPSKMVANYAGVATGNDVRNDIIVRGNSPLGVLWRLEGVDIPNPNHFSTQGATGGPVSILNNNLLGASDFLTGAFPAEYGNRNAAVFDLKLRHGNNEKYEYTGQIGFNGLEAGLEGPMFRKKGGSFLVNYRYSTFEIFDALGVSFGVSSVPHYMDVTYKFSLPTAKHGVFSIWGIGGTSHIDLLDSQKDTTDWSFTSKGEDLRFISRMGATGFNHIYFFNPNLSQRFSLSVSGSVFKITLDTLSVLKVPYRQYDNTSIDRSALCSYTLTWKHNAHHLFKAGVNYIQAFFDYHARYWSNDYLLYVDELKNKNNAGIGQAYFHWQYRITENLALNSGLHYQLFLLNSTRSIEPRSGLRWQFAKKHALSLAFGMHSQMQPLMYYFYNEYDPASNTTLNTNRDLGLTRSIHYVAAYDLNFGKNFRMKLESYYQHLYDVPVMRYGSSSFSLVNLGNDLEGLELVDSLSNTGTGSNYGAEFTLEKFFSKNYYFLTDLSLYQSKYKGNDGIERNSAFAGGYVFNTLGGIEIPLGKKNKILGFDLKVTFAGGNRYTPIDVNRSIQYHYGYRPDSLAWSEKFRDYQKIDVKVSFKINTKRATQNIFIHVENVLNRQNILQQVWDDTAQKVKEDYQLGLFPYAGYRIEF